MKLLIALMAFFTLSIANAGSWEECSAKHEVGSADWWQCFQGDRGRLAPQGTWSECSKKHTIGSIDWWNCLQGDRRVAAISSQCSHLKFGSIDWWNCMSDRGR